MSFQGIGYSDLEKAAIGASGACGHFFQNPAILRMEDGGKRVEDGGLRLVKGDFSQIAEELSFAVLSVTTGCFF